MQWFQRAVIGVLGVLLLVVIVQSVVPRTYVKENTPPPTQEACKGSPIEVDYPFEGAFLEPWECKIQCDDDQPRYILYANGKATQCQPPPGCNDWGEDNGVECVLPE
jgi:hypothetical protein